MLTDVTVDWLNTSKARILIHEAKTRLCKTLVKPVLMYGSETKFDISTLRAFERKILRKIYGPIQARG
jgi:hypothetical protein